MKHAISFAAGLLFGLGLVVSGMNDPAKVKNFLDLFGTWDPSLAFVMAGALGVTFLGYRFVLARPRPLLVERFSLPTARDVDLPLVLGAALFGIGWGLAGFCPGPAITALATLEPQAWMFFIAMLAGMAAARHLQGRTPAIGAPAA